MIESGSISLPDDSIKASMHQVFVVKDAVDINESQTVDYEERLSGGTDGTPKAKASKSIESISILPRRMNGMLSELREKRANFSRTGSDEKKRSLKNGQTRSSWCNNP